MNLVSTSKFLSLVLRHQPEVIEVVLDAEGWLEIDLLIANANARGKRLSRELIHEVVANCSKQRFALSEDGLRIRANQGHSVSGVDLKLEPVEPPETLFHGTVANFLDSIRTQGLQSRARHHVHLSGDIETASKVGQRRGKPIIISADSGRMHGDGFMFYRSANGVWLTDSVQPEYLSLP